MFAWCKGLHAGTFGLSWRASQRTGSKQAGNARDLAASIARSVKLIRNAFYCLANIVAVRCWIVARSLNLHRMAVIYIIKASNGLLKIGMTSNPRARVRSLQTGSPLHLTIAHKQSVPTPRARTAEKRIHHKLRHARVHGEWFKCPLERAQAELNRICLRETQAHAESFMFEKGDSVAHLEEIVPITCKHCGHSKLLQLTVAQIARGRFRCGACGKRT